MMTDREAETQSLLGEGESLLPDNDHHDAPRSHSRSSRDFNKNLLANRKLSLSTWNQTKTPFIWRTLCRRKHVLCLLAAALVLLLVNSTLVRNDDNILVLNHLHSHVPGMKIVGNRTHYNNDSGPNDPTEGLARRSPAGLTMGHLNETTSGTTGSTITEAATTTYSQQSHSSNSSFSSLSTTAASADRTVAARVPTPPAGYLVWSDHCKMPNIDPYQPEIMKYFKREKYKSCQIMKPLTRVEYNASAERYALLFNEDVLPSNSKWGALECCYQSIERNSTGANADKLVSLSECVTFRDGTLLEPSIDNILVKCYVRKKRVYVDGHPLMPEREEVRKRLDLWKDFDEKSGKTSRPSSVLMIGIDSISRVNLIRAMPKTAQYLYDNGWFELSGFNKIDDNTFPNLMAVLTGLNKSTALRTCSPTKLHSLDNCDFVWKLFRDHGYVTAYAEDESSINTFNYLKVGFERPPVDYYLRPFLISAEKHLQIKRKSNLIYCLGYKHSAEFVYDYAVELAKRFRNDTFFGLFWTNTFSHNAISDCSAMDDRMAQYLRTFVESGALENTIVVFFSDHGMRYGPTRKTYSGHLEERLPFMFMWLPQRLRQAYPELASALSVNKNRLTNPYDLHMTLKHILAMSGRVEHSLLTPANGCPACQTLLQPVPHNRSCDDVAIEAHWCTCLQYQSVYKNSKTIRKLAHSLVDYINDYVANLHNKTYASICGPLQFDSVESAYRSQLRVPAHGSGGNKTAVDTYRIIFYTKPNKALFEATVHYNSETGLMEVTGEVSRLNSYSSDSECVSDGAAKKYCSCHKKRPF